MDRRSLQRKLTELKPDQSKKKGGRVFNSYYMAAVVKHLSGASDLDYTTERARLAKEQADKTEMENEFRRAELVEASVMVELIGGHIHATKNKLLALPSQLSPYLANKSAQDVQSQLTDAIHDALTEISEGTEQILEAAETPEG